MGRTFLLPTSFSFVMTTRGVALLLFVFLSRNFNLGQNIALLLASMLLGVYSPGIMVGGGKHPLTCFLIELSIMMTI